MSEFNPKTIKIGNIEWMQENLNITDKGLGKDHWKNPNTGEVYYSLEAAMRIANKVPGYRLPSPEEWNQLIENCGGVCINPYENNPGLKDFKNIQELKKKLGIKLVGCYSPFAEGFFAVGVSADFWPYTEKSKGDSYYRDFGREDGVYSYYGRIKYGLSVRLIKD